MYSSNIATGYEADVENFLLKKIRMIGPKKIVFLIFFNVVFCSGQLTANDFSNRVQSAISQAKKQIELLRIESNVPGISVGVSYRGEELWTDGFGFADLETGAPCTSRSLHRIGSITKSISMLLLGKLLEENRIDLDRPIYDYLDDAFPRKTFNGNEVNITLRQLVSHMGGIRHYLSDTEFHQKEGCESRLDSLKYFKDDELVAEPGTEFHYTSFGFVTIGAVLESVLNPNETFESAMLSILRNDLGMRETYFDEVEEIILNRVNYYQINDDNEMKIAPFVDASCRWPGGGMLSNVHDLLRFGNAMIHSNNSNGGYLENSTVNRLWDKVVHTGSNDLFNTYYGMGWDLMERKSSNCLECESVPFSIGVGHSGGSSGAIANLLIVPEAEMVVATLTNISPLPSLGQVNIEIMSTFIEYLNQAEYGSEESHANLILNSKLITLTALVVVLFKNY